MRRVACSESNCTPARCFTARTLTLSFSASSYVFSSIKSYGLDATVHSLMLHRCTYLGLHQGCICSHCFFHPAHLAAHQGQAFLRARRPCCSTGLISFLVVLFVGNLACNKSRSNRACQLHGSPGVSPCSPLAVVLQGRSSLFLLRRASNKVFARLRNLLPRAAAMPRQKKAFPSANGSPSLHDVAELIKQDKGRPLRIEWRARTDLAIVRLVLIGNV